jgi:Ser/Thr protein kinase RdoA (MazF antagonist)
MSASARPPSSVLAAFGLDAAELHPIEIGLINTTFEVRDGGEARYVLQRLHPVFAGEVCLDLEAIASHVARRGLMSPQLVRARDGRAFVRDEGDWRLITFVPGRTITAITDARQAYEAARLASRFHAAVADLAHTFHFTRGGVHDTAAHLARLEGWLDRGRGHAEHDENARIAEAILSHAARLAPLPALPARIVHGDLKISNVRFDDALHSAVALLDLDTLAHGTIAFELGDALRSWTNRGGESAEAARADEEILRAAMEGYASGGARLERIEQETIVLGLETVATELAARFAVDAWEDAYFGWDRARYPSRRAHDRARATSQLALARAVGDRRGDLERIVAVALR